MAALLGVLQNIPGLLLVAVPGRPAVQLPLGAAAELQQLLPVLLEEVQHPGDGRVLLCLGAAKGGPAHMDMEAAGVGLVAGVAQLHSPAQQLLPGHLLRMVAQRHGMGHQLKAIVQGAVVFAVEPLLPFPVGDADQFPGVVVALSSLVDLQLHSEEPGAVPEENGSGFVAVVLDGVGLLHPGVAALAHGILLVLIVGGVAGRFQADEGAAAVAASIVVVIAPLAKRRLRRSGIVIAPDPLSAYRAHGSFLPEALRAEIPSVELMQLIHGDLLQTAAAGEGRFSLVFFHDTGLLNVLFSLVAPGYIQEDNIQLYMQHFPKV